MARHPDFEKIYHQFQARYCTGEDDPTSPKGGPCEKGDQVYYAWLNKMGLDDTKPYPESQTEAFKWAEPTIKFLQEDEKLALFQCEAAFPVISMNQNIYAEDELMRGTRTLIGSPVNLNHTSIPLLGVEIVDAEYEDGAVECVLAVDKDYFCPVCETQYKIVDMLMRSPEIPQEAHIHHVSIEGSCRTVDSTDEGNLCHGLRFTALALLTKRVLPGMPLTRLIPVESIVESFTVTQTDEMKLLILEKQAEERRIAGRGEEAPPPPTKPDIISRVKELKLQGLSQRDSWRLACFELLDWIQKHDKS